MSLKIKHLNSDSSFLLTFTPDEPQESDIYPPSPTSDVDFNLDTFSILIDPWLPSSKTTSRRKSISRRQSTTSYIRHLSDIPEPDIIIISQDRPDHCHEQTLRQLSAETRAVIIAEPRAARRIRRFHYFRESRIFSLPRYDCRKPTTICRIQIPALTFSGLPGEVTLALVSPKIDFTGLHNAIGITYRPPTSTGNTLPTTSLDLPIQSMANGANFLRPAPALHSSTSMPNMSSKDSPLEREDNDRPGSSSSSYAESVTSTVLNLPIQNFTHPGLHKRRSTLSTVMTLDLPIQGSEGSKAPSVMTRHSTIRLPIQHNAVHFHTPLLTPPPDSPASTSVSSSVIDLALTQTTSHNRTPPLPPPSTKTLTILYIPHGIPSHSLFSYATNHLFRINTRLSLLLHPFDRVQSPWYFGGCISTGAPGGAGVVDALNARAWISCHDERKESSSLGSLGSKKTRRSIWSVEEVKKLLSRESDTKDSENEEGCEVNILNSGNEHLVLAD